MMPLATISFADHLSDSAILSEADGIRGASEPHSGGDKRSARG